MAWIAVSGFGSFLDVVRNPSGEIAAALAEAGGEGEADGVEVRHVVLPVTLHGAARELDRWLARQGAEPPLAVLSLGVQEHDYFRLERRARALLVSEKHDNDGVVAAGLSLEGGRDLETDLDLLGLAAALRSAGAHSVRISDDAGGYVCERLYHHALRRSSRRGSPAVFLHVPPGRAAPVERQVPVVRGMLPELVRQARARS